MEPTMALRSSTFGKSTCRRLKARSCWVSDPARSPAFLIYSISARSGSDGPRFLRRSWLYPVMIVKRLLKS